MALALAGCLMNPPQRVPPAGSIGGVITTGQRIAPAGIQTTFDGRVEGVSFGAGDDLADEEREKH